MVLDSGLFLHRPLQSPLALEDDQGLILRVSHEQPVVTLYTCGPWCQGPVSIQALQILEGVDLKSMGHNSADYIHAVLEALSLSLSDREAFYGDPDWLANVDHVRSHLARRDVTVINPI